MPQDALFRQAAVGDQLQQLLAPRRQERDPARAGLRDVKGTIERGVEHRLQVEGMVHGRRQLIQRGELPVQSGQCLLAMTRLLEQAPGEILGDLPLRLPGDILSHNQQ